MQYGMSGSVVAESDPQASQGLATALLDCRLRGIETVLPVDSYEKLSGRIHTDIPPQEWMSCSDGFNPSQHYLRVKSVLDFIGALFLFIIAAPIMAAVALAIKLTSPGPVLFRQVRVGQDGRDFVLYKFRSMPEHVEAKTGPVWSGDGDSRATPVGHFLRRFHLDELPQVFNVLRGEMSLVGPRPERRCFVSFLRRLIPNYNLRHSVKPGITGLAQVFYPYGASVEDAHEKLRYELYYARHISLGLDLRALAKTISVVLAGRGS
jgi:exopolysaccharide biosynthesis polyprenyl glycosylphosphotransferase